MFSVLGDADLISQDEGILLISAVTLVVITDSDTLIVGITEGETLNKYVFITDTDTLIVGITEGETLTVTFLALTKSDSDNLIVGITDTEAALFKFVFISASDELIIGITEGELLTTTSVTTLEEYIRRYLNDVVPV